MQNCIGSDFFLLSFFLNKFSVMGAEFLRTPHNTFRSLEKGKPDAQMHQN